MYFLAAAIDLAITPGPGIAYVAARTVPADRPEREFRAMNKRPLYRKENTTAHRPSCHSGVRYRDHRNTRDELRSEALRGSMHAGQRHGLDYTPLYRFLLSRIGQPWNAVYSEAVDRLDRPDPIFRMVALDENRRQAYVRVGDSSYFSGLFVDADGILRAVDPSLGPSSLVPLCKCCTHTFNGVRFTRRFPG